MKQVKIEVSARHCHLSQDDLNVLFGNNYELKQLKDLSQPGQFAAEEQIILKTDAGQIENLRILGPVRKQTQVEITMTDARKLKIKPPIRLSGDLAGSAGAILIGPKGEVAINEGVIVAKRHLHCDTATAQEWKLTEEKTVNIETPGERGVILKNIPVRISDKFTLSLHLDTDEGNASLPDGVCSIGEIIN